MEHSTPVIALMSPQAGAGKTTLALGLAQSFAQQGLRTLCIDADPAATLTHLLHQENVVGLDTVLLDQTPVSGLILGVSPQLDVLVAGAELASADCLRARTDAALLANALSPIRSAYDVLVVDTAGHSAMLAANVLQLADWVLCPVRLQANSIEAASELVTMLSRFEQVMHRRPELRVVANAVPSMHQWQAFAPSLQRVFRSQLHERPVPDCSGDSAIEPQAQWQEFSAFWIRLFTTLAKPEQRAMIQA